LTEEGYTSHEDAPVVVKLDISVTPQRTTMK
jgi:hypothetical protein